MWDKGGQWQFQNDLYRKLEGERRDGLTEHFWTFLVDEVS